MAVGGWGIFFILLVIVVVLGGAGYILWAHYRARRLGLPPPNLNPFHRRRENPSAPSYRAPTPAPGGLQGWFADKWNALRNQRTAGGAYESTGYGGGGGGRRSTGDRRGFGPLDPDEAWDTRVMNEADGYYEEQELGLQDPGHGPYGGSGYGGGGGRDVGVGVGGIEEGRGRSVSRQRELDARYEQEMHGGAGASRLQQQQQQQHQLATNPFGDQAEASSLRSVSPRPQVETRSARRGFSAHNRGQSSLGTMGSAEDSPTERRSMFREDV